MVRTIAVANQKGGVGKTTTAVNLGASLAAAERRVLVIDMDPQGNLSSGFGYSKADVAGQHVYHVLTGECSIEEVTLPAELDQLSVVPAHPDLIGAEIELVGADDRHLRLANAVGSVADRFDYVLIDCPPSLGMLTLNALVAADAVLVPLQCEYYALEGLSQLLSTIERVRAIYNPRLEVEGILLCMFDKRTNLTHQVAEEVRSHFDGKVFDSVIPRNVRLSEAPSFGKPVILYDVQSAGAQGYLTLADELIRREPPVARRHSAAPQQRPSGGQV